MADNELNLHINTVFDGAEKLSKQIADSIPKSGMNKKRASATSQKLAGTDAQLSQLESIWQQMDPQEALASLRKILVSYEKINFGMAKYSAEAQKEIQDLTDQIESKQEELDNLSRKDKINRGKLGSVRYSRDENGNIVGVKSLTLGSTEIKAGLPDVLKGTDLDVDKGTRAALLNAQKDDSLTDEQKKAAEAYIAKVQVEEADLLKQLNDEIQLREKLKQLILDLEAQKSKKIENATTPSDTFSEDNAINTGTTEQLIKNTNDAADAAKKAAGGEKDLGEETAKTEKKQKKQDNTVTKAIKSFFGYQQVIRALRTVVNFTVKTITDLDKALTDQAIVSGLSRDQVYGLVKSYETLANQTGFTTTEIADTASKFLQQGKTVAETLKLTKAAAESARVAGISASQAVDYLTTALNGFQMTADQSLEVSDKFAALAAASATSYEELAVALSKVASQANLAGMSMDYTLALLAKGVETTRESAESIGTALKTVIARMREITDYGATLEDGTDVNNVETQLKAIGISLRDNAGELRSTQDVLNEVGLKWDKLSSNQQAALAKALAGTRQQSRLISMMDNYGRTLELLEISQNSLGATEAQQAKYMQSMAAATNNVQVAWQGLVTKLTNSQVIIDIVNGFATAIKTVTENEGLLWTVIIGLSAALIAYGIIMTIDWVKTNKLTGAKLAEATANGTLTVSQLILNTAMWANPVFWLVAGFVALAAILAVVIIVLANQETANQKSIKSMKALTAEAYNFKKTASDFDSITGAFDEVDKKVIKTAADMKSLSETTDKAKELLNNLNTSDSRDKSLLKSIFGTDDKGTISNYINSASQGQIEKWSKEASKAAREKANQANKGVISEAIKNQDVLNTSEGLSLTKNAVSQLGYSSIKEVGEASKMTTEEISNIGTTWESMVDSLDASDLAGKSQTELENMGKNFANYMSSINSNTISTFYDSSASLKDRVEAYNKITANMAPDMLKAFNATYPEFKGLINNYGSAISTGLVDKLGISTDALNQFAEDLSDIAKEGGFTISTEQQDKLLSKMGDMMVKGASFDDITKEISNELNVSAADAAKIAGALGTAGSNGKTILDSAETQANLASKASNLRETQGKWTTMSDAEKDEYIANHSDFFKISGAREAFESGADITSYIKGAYGEDQQKLIQQYTNQAIAAQARIEAAKAAEEEAIKNGDAAAKKAAEEELADAQEQYTEAVKSKDDAEKLYDLSLDEIVKKQDDQISKFKDVLKQQQSDLIDSLNARKQAYQDYFDAINAAYDEQNFEQEETRLQQQIVKLSGGTDATSQNKIIELQKSLKTLQDNHSETARKNAQEAVLNNIDAEIDKVNQYYEDALNNDQTMIDLLNEWLTSGKSRDEYSAYLKEQGYSSAKYEQAMKSFDNLYADGKVAGEWMNNSEATKDNTNALKESNSTLKMIALANAMYIAGNMNLGTTAAPEIKTDKSGNTFIEFNGKTFALDENSSENLQQFMLELMKTSKTVSTVKG